LKAAYFYEAVENHVALIGIAAYTLQVNIVPIPKKLSFHSNPQDIHDNKNCTK